MSKGWLLKEQSVQAENNQAEVVDDAPLFTQVRSKKDKENGLPVHPLQDNTISIKAGKYMLSNISDEGDTLLVKYGAHSFRHAVASMLNFMNVSAEEIAGHLQIAPETVKKYTRTVLRDWEIPRKCVQDAEQLAIKLLIPFIHFITTDEPGGCACKRFYYHV